MLTSTIRNFQRFGDVSRTTSGTMARIVSSLIGFFDGTMGHPRLDAA